MVAGAEEPATLSGFLNSFGNLVIAIAAEALGVKEFAASSWRVRKRWLSVRIRDSQARPHLIVCSSLNSLEKFGGDWCGGGDRVVEDEVRWRKNLTDRVYLASQLSWDRFWGRVHARLQGGKKNKF